MHHLVHRSVMMTVVPIRCYYAALMRSREQWPAERIRRFQDKRLRRLIRYCWRHVPLYREKWRGHIDGPEEIRTVDDLQALPLLTKSEVRERLGDMTTTAPSVRSAVARTGGSTGQPVVFRMTRFDEELSWAQMYVGWVRAGYRFGDPLLVVGGESVGVGQGDKRSWRDALLNRWVSSGSNLTRERVQALAGSPHFHRLRLIYGYPNAIRELCEHLATLGERPRGLVGVVCTAEVMLPEVRARISEVLGVDRVLDQYGLNDGGLHACEGPEQDGFHVSFHRGVLEIVDDRNRQITALATTGRAIATTTSNFATPFVRYETGDQLHWQSFDPSPSGITWPRIGPIDGRTGDVIFLSTGRSIAMPGLTLVMRWLDGLLQYQFIQTGPDAVTVRLDRGPEFSLTEEEVIRYLRDKIAAEIDWTIEWGPAQPTRNGKLLVIRNDWLRARGLSRPPDSRPA